jgi:hypothetical protein
MFSEFGIIGTTVGGIDSSDSHPNGSSSGPKGSKIPWRARLLSHADRKRRLKWRGRMFGLMCCMNRPSSDFFEPNIDRKGRVARIIWGLIPLAPGAVLVSRKRPWLGGALILMGGFSLFEAARGWCLLRACGIKTKF